MGTRYFPFPVARLSLGLAGLFALTAPLNAEKAPLPASPDRQSEFTVSETFEKKFTLEKPQLSLGLPLDQILPPPDAGVSSDRTKGPNLDLDRSLRETLGVPESEILAKPWLADIPGPIIARFRFEVPKNRRFSGWKLQITDGEGNMVSQIEKSGTPPNEVPWDGKTLTDQPVKVGATYSYRLLLTDRYGRSSTYLGKSFDLPEMQYDQDRNRVVEISLDRLFLPKTATLAPAGREVLERAVQLMTEQYKPNYTISLRDPSSENTRKERILALKRFISPRVHVAMEELNLEAPSSSDRNRILQIILPN